MQLRTSTSENTNTGKPVLNLITGQTDKKNTNLTTDDKIFLHSVVKYGVFIYIFKMVLHMAKHKCQPQANIEHEGIGCSFHDRSHHCKH
jgi:hypothetical protein